MALRAFRSNPSLGGFGGESSGAPPAVAQPPSTGGGRSSSSALPPTEAGSGGGSGSSRRALVSDGNRNNGGGRSDGGDAFAQIVKELVDNAVDACSGGGGGGAAAAEAGAGEEEEAPVLKRVRVVIEPVDRERGDGNADDDDDDDANDERWGERDLRISVNDNGGGMESIESCVEAFRTSKRSDSDGDGARISRMQQQDGDGSQDEENGEHDANGPPQRGTSNTAGEQTLTAGRYGIGLTLCLLHSQRLCPKSAASITSATAASRHWTRASYVVDAEGDRVECVKKELLPKKADESGTMVSLLVPGGEGAQRVWPRLAEYFARFQLSVGVKCSLEVKAPSLSSVPLYIRPPFEVNRQKVLEKRRRVAANKSIASASGDDTTSASAQDPRTGHLDEEWNDGMLSSDDANDGHDSISSGESAKRLDRRSVSGKGDDNGIAEPPPTDVGGETEESRRQAIARAVSSYLNRPIELKNVAHSVQPIRRYGQTEDISSSRPMLEVDMIVYGPDDGRSDEGEGSEAESDNNSSGDEFENMFAQRGSSALNGSVANLMLIRMVNDIPLLDGAEALGCGLVRGITTKGQSWNSFGLDVSPATELRPSALPSSDTPVERTPTSEYTPTYSIRDSAQVAPFFRSSAHSLFESEDDADDTEGSGGEESDGSEDDDKRPREKRKRKARVQLLPAGLRLGHVLIIAMIRAKPSALPLPTLSKGRLPVNDAGIDDALTLTLTSCLRSLQRTNPELLLTAYQLKRTERDVRYIPAVSASLASIIKKSSGDSFQSDMMDKINSWEKENRAVGSVPVAETTSSQNIGPSDAVDTQLSRGEQVGSRSTLLTMSCDERNAAPEPNQQVRLLSVAKLGRLIENQLRFCISDQNKARRKQEEQERKRDARRKEKCEEEEEAEDGSGSGEESGDKPSDDDGGLDLDGILECSDEESTPPSTHKDRVRRCSQASSPLSVDKSMSSSRSRRSRSLSGDGSMRSEGEWSEQQSPSSNLDPRRKNNTEQEETSTGQKVGENEDDFDDDGWW